MRRVPSLKKRAQKSGRSRIGVEQWNERVSKRERAREEREEQHTMRGRHAAVLKHNVGGRQPPKLAPQKPVLVHCRIANEYRCTSK